MTTTLREVTRTDLPAITAWRRDRALIAHLGAPFRFINRETDEAWFDDYLKHPRVTGALRDLRRRDTHWTGEPDADRSGSPARRTAYPDRV